MKTYRVIGVDGSHMHLFWMLRDLQPLEGFQLVGHADADPARRQEAQQKFGLDASQTLADVRQLVEEQKPDIAIVGAPNTRHHEYVETLAAMGVHCIVEKPFAARLWQADRMIDACRKHGVILMCNFPSAWSASLRAAQARVQNGDIGRMFQLTHRGGHTGPVPELDTWWYRPEDGGGVFLDYCCYGAALSTWFMGRLPARVTAMAVHADKPVRAEDNAVLLLDFDDALCICQGTWTRFGKEPSYGPVINGLDGSITIQGGGRYLLVTRDNPDGEVVQVSGGLPQGQESAVQYMATCIKEGHWPEGPLALDITRGAQEILEAGQLAIRTGATVSLPMY